jgi:MraZ protein
VGVQDYLPFTAMPVGTLDKKARVCIPAQYRQILTAQNTRGVYMREALLTPSLECFGASVMQAFHEAQAQQDPLFTSVHDVDAFSLLSMSQDLAIDETGRVRLPESFIAYAGLSEHVTFVGMGRKFEIWDSEKFAPVREERRAAAQARARAQLAGRS